MDRDALAEKLVEQRIEDLREALSLIDAERERTRIEIQQAERLLDTIILRRWLARSTDAA